MPRSCRAVFDSVRDEVYPARMPLADRMREEEGTCGNCAYWAFARAVPVYARFDGALVAVAQCLGAGEMDAAPHAAVSGQDAAVFTQEGSRCRAFVPHPDLVHDDALADDPLY